MSRKITVLIALAAAVILLALALLLVDFRIVTSRTSAVDNYTSARGSAMPPEKLHIYVWVEEKDRLSTQLRDQLVDDLNHDGRLQVELLPGETPTPADVPLLRVWISRPGYSWTPVYAQAEMEVKYGFSTYNSNISFDEKVPVMIDNRSAYPLVVRGAVDLSDRTAGLISLPGYWSWLANQASTKISTDLEASIK